MPPLLVFQGVAALLSPPPPASNLLSFTVLAAFTTSMFTIVGIVLKDYVFRILDEKRTERKSQLAIYERYANPLVNSAISLLNRLHEILYQQHRPVYLLGKGVSSSTNPGGAYRAYKKLSVLYRLASMLGWIQACRREFSYLCVAEIGEADEIQQAIDDFENSLADGSWVEWERVRRLCDLWLLCDLDTLEETPAARGFAIQLDNLIWDRLEVEGIEDLSLLGDTARRALCRTVSSHLSLHLRTNDVAEASLDRSWPDAFAILSMREAWIYRDWQGAIGDLMIRPSGGQERKFGVMGFGEFEELIPNAGEKWPASLTRLLDVFDDLNMEIEDRFDARPTQLRSVARATAQLILAIDKTQRKHSIVSPRSKKLASEVLAK